MRVPPNAHDRHPFNDLFSRTTWVRQHQKGLNPLWISLNQEMMGGIGISWTICRSFARFCRQISMPAAHHSIFYRLDALPQSWHPAHSIKALKAV